VISDWRLEIRDWRLEIREQAQMTKSKGQIKAKAQMTIEVQMFKCQSYLDIRISDLAVRLPRRLRLLAMTSGKRLAMTWKVSALVKNTGKTGCDCRNTRQQAFFFISKHSPDITDCDFNNLHQNQISFVPFSKSYGAPFRFRRRHELTNSFKHLFELSIILLLKGV